MSRPDWIVLAITLCTIVLYGLYKSRTTRNLDGYFLSNRSMPWWLVLLSIMGTQASAITFISVPGQAFTDGMRFVQAYFGLPLAMIVICVSFVPIFKKFKVYTAYEFLEQRFDIKTRTFTSFLFLLSRGFSTGISVYAPSIIVSSLLGWDIFWTNIFMGGLLIIYTVSGGARAVAYTQQLQIAIIFAAMFITGYYVVHQMPANVGFSDALHVSGATGKLNVITTGITENGFEWKDKFNIISGILGGFFLSLSYFGTDQSQVGRYLTAKDLKQSKLGLLMNGLIKVPMQFFILLVGALLFTYYQFNSGPIFFNKTMDEKVYQTEYGDSLRLIESRFDALSKKQSSYSQAYVAGLKNNSSSAVIMKDSVAQTAIQLTALRTTYKDLLHKADKSIDINDTNYIFLRFVVDTLPAGLVGLLIAIIFLASWGSIAAALNALASCTMIDFYCRFKKHQVHPDMQDIEDVRKYRLSKWVTLGWGIFCIAVAEFSGQMGSLIQAVNEYGSLFYGAILGIFLVAFYMKRIKGNAVFISAILTEVLVVTIYILDKTGVIGFGFLWLNVVGALGVVLFSSFLQLFSGKNRKIIS